MHRVREATKNDIAFLTHCRVEMMREIVKSKGKDLPQEIIAQVTREFSQILQEELNTLHIGWVVEADSQIAAGGMITIQKWLPSWLYPNQRRAYYHSVYTVPGHRNKGYAKLITQAAIDWCKTNGFPSMILHASDAGRSIYEKLGFKDANEMRLDFE